VPRHDEVGANEPAARGEEAPDQRRRDGEWRVGDHAEGLAREPEVRRVRHDHDHRFAPEPLPELLGAAVMQFHGDHPGAGCNELCGQRTRSGSDVEDEVTR
jgi:hypothetical protein